MSSFFVENPDQKFLLFQNLLGCIHSNSCHHFIRTSSWLVWTTLFVNLHTENFLSAKDDNDMNTFFEATPDQKFLLFKKLLGWLHSRPHFIWTSPWLEWKTFFVNLAYRDLHRRKIWKFDNNMSTFFVENPDQKFHSCHHFIWKSSWLVWKTLFVNLQTETYTDAKFDNDMSTFFRRKPTSKIPSVSEPTRMDTLELLPSFHLNKFITRLKNTFCEPAYRQFFSAKFDNDMSTFFEATPNQKFLLLKKLLGWLH